MTNSPGDFAAIMAEANKMAEGGLAHPFGMTPVSIIQGGRGRAVPARQTTEMCYCPKELEKYDAICNRALAGEIQIRFEERTFTKEGEWLVVVSYLERRAPPQPNEVPAEGDTEPEERPVKLP